MSLVFLTVIGFVLLAVLAMLCSPAKGFMSLRVTHNGRTAFRKGFKFGFAAVMVGVLLLGAATPALATGYGQQAVVVQQYAVPQQVVVPYAVQQQQAACVVQQFQAYSAPLVQQQIVRQQVLVPQQFSRQRSFSRSRGGFSSFSNVQQFNSGGRQRSFSIQSSSSGRGGLRNLFPF